MLSPLWKVRRNSECAPERLDSHSIFCKWDGRQINSIRLLTVKKSMTRCGTDVKSSLESPTQFRMCSGEAG
ncbi:hypothetical protein TNCV_2856361 [Trichonephila clavipes]|nr:hypothetical protein TNCV_2856361 [Trichonephila clavipes]